MHYESFGFFGDDVDYNLIEVIGDSVIENTACRIIERRLLSFNLRPIIDYVFEENGEVFYWHSDTTGFKLLYDFNK